MLLLGLGLGLSFGIKGVASQMVQDWAILKVPDFGGGGPVVSNGFTPYPWEIDTQEGDKVILDGTPVAPTDETLITVEPGLWGFYMRAHYNNWTNTNTGFIVYTLLKDTINESYRADTGIFNGVGNPMTNNVDISRDTPTAGIIRLVETTTIRAGAHFSSSGTAEVHSTATILMLARIGN